MDALRSCHDLDPTDEPVVVGSSGRSTPASTHVTDHFPANPTPSANRTETCREPPATKLRKPLGRPLPSPQ